MTYQFSRELDRDCGVDLTEETTREINMVQLGRALTSLGPPLKAT